MFMSREEALCVYVLTGLLIVGSIALLWVNRPMRTPGPPGGVPVEGAPGPDEVVVETGDVGGVTEGEPTPGTGAAATDAAPDARAQRRVVVHVSGAVKNPGVYRLNEGDRVNDAVTAAGGPSPDAFVDAINLAARLEDGQRVYVPTKQEVAGGGPVGGPPGAAWGPGLSGKVNINSAGKEQLEALPGIGPGLAAAIIEYRQRNGGFRAIEDLMKVGGIGPKTLARLRPLVTVN